MEEQIIEQTSNEKSKDQIISELRKNIDQQKNKSKKGKLSALQEELKLYYTSGHIRFDKDAWIVYLEDFIVRDIEAAFNYIQIVDTSKPYVLETMGQVLRNFPGREYYNEDHYEQFAKFIHERNLHNEISAQDQKKRHLADNICDATISSKLVKDLKSAFEIGELVQMLEKAQVVTSGFFGHIFINETFRHAIRELEDKQILLQVLLYLKDKTNLRKTLKIFSEVKVYSTNEDFPYEEIWEDFKWELSLLNRETQVASLITKKENIADETLWTYFYASSTCNIKSLLELVKQDPEGFKELFIEEITCFKKNVIASRIHFYQGLLGALNYNDYVYHKDCLREIKNTFYILNLNLESEEGKELIDIEPRRKQLENNAFFEEEEEEVVEEIVPTRLVATASAGNALKQATTGITNTVTQWMSWAKKSVSTVPQEKEQDKNEPRQHF